MDIDELSCRRNDIRNEIEQCNDVIRQYEDMIKSLEKFEGVVNGTQEEFSTVMRSDHESLGMARNYTDRNSIIRKYCTGMGNAILSDCHDAYDQFNQLKEQIKNLKGMFDNNININRQQRDDAWIRLNQVERDINECLKQS